MSQSVTVAAIFDQSTTVVSIGKNVYRQATGVVSKASCSLEHFSWLEVAFVDSFGLGSGNHHLWTPTARAFALRNATPEILPHMLA